MRAASSTGWFCAALVPLICGLAVSGLEGCSPKRTPAPATSAIAAGAASYSAAAPTAPPPAPASPGPPEPYRAVLEHTRGAVLYLPPWFQPTHGGYDLLLHFHGEGRFQEANIEHAHLNVAVVSVNLGAGTDPYAHAFRGPDAFDKLLETAEAEIAKSGRAGGAQLRRIAFSAWSAGFSSVSSLLTDESSKRVDAILLADGFFTNFTKPRLRTVNEQGLTKFARFADAAERDDKLFVITHTTIPTGPYPSVQECVTKLLQMLDLPKTKAIAIGPRDMRQFYTVDHGSFHIRGFEGTLAADHVKQLHAMGETEYPYLKARWEKLEAEEEAALQRERVASRPAGVKP